MSGIHCEKIVKSFGKGNGKTVAVQGISETFQTGVFYSVIGRSGSGKSTLLHLLSGITQPDSGSIYYDDVEINTLGKKEQNQIRRTRTGFVFQDYQLLPELTVFENMILPLVLNDSPIDEAWCNRILHQLEIEDISHRYPDEISGGQQQRTAIGRAIVHKPSFIFADEPTGNLDKKTSESVLKLLVDIRALYDPMILLVTHDLDIARSADKLLHIEDGRFVTADRGVLR